MDTVINLLSFNMRGFKNGCNVVRDLLNSNTIIALQLEHWLRPDNLSTLGLISDDVSYYVASGMSRDMSSGIFTEVLQLFGTSSATSLSKRLVAIRVGGVAVLRFKLVTGVCLL